MAGFRASPLRRRCSHCKTTFKPKRSDAEYCCNLCRQAGYHKRKDAAAAVKAEAVFEERQREALAVIDQFERYQSHAGLLHVRARANDINLRYMATRVGVLMVEGGSGSFGSLLRTSGFPSWWSETKTTSDSPEVKALLSLPSLAGGSFIARDAEADFRKVLQRSGALDVSLFALDWDRYCKNLPVVSLPTWPEEDDEFELRDRERQAWDGTDKFDESLLDGFRVFDRAKGDK